MSRASNSSLKQSRSALTSVTSALEAINVMRSINPRFTYFSYLLTYMLSLEREKTVESHSRRQEQSVCGHMLTRQMLTGQSKATKPRLSAVSTLPRFAVPTGMRRNSLFAF